MPPVVQDGGGGSIGAGPSTGARRLTPAVSRPQLVQLTVSSNMGYNTGHSVPLVTRYQVPGLAPSSAKRSFSGIEPLGVDFLGQHAPENQPIPDAYTSYPWSSSPFAARYQTAIHADMVPGPSSLTHRESVVSTYSEEFSSSSALQGDLDSNATFSPRYASPGAPSLAGQTLPQRGTSLAAPEALRKKRCTRKRNRVATPKDPKGAERLQNQRQSDDEHIEYLYKLFVPDSVGAVPKKERLGLSTSQSLCFPPR